MSPSETNTHLATFAAGCFWGVEETFRQLDGVVDTQVGYIGGHKDDPTYQEVCRKDTGHAEAVEVEYDPEKIDYEALLEVFWNAHDPTQVNRQGPDVGSQYRSAVFVHSPEQEETARASKEALDASGKLNGPVATEITEAETFWRAEDYHQKYLAKRGMSSCAI